MPFASLTNAWVVPGLCPVASPYEIILVQCCGYMHTGVLWDLCICFDHGIARYRTRTRKGSVRFMCGHRIGLRAWEYPDDYVCVHRAGPCGCHIGALKYPYDQSCRAVGGPIRPVSAPSCNIYQVNSDYVLFDT